MPLQPCPDCGQQVSTLAEACPNCGRPRLPATQSSPPSSAASSTRQAPPAITPEFLKVLGIILFLGGVAAAVYYYGYFDTTVTTERVEIFGEVIGGQRVHNVGLMQERQIGLIISIGAALLGLVALFVAQRQSDGGSSPLSTQSTPPEKACTTNGVAVKRLCSACGVSLPPDATVCSNCDRRLNSTDPTLDTDGRRLPNSTESR